MLDHPTIVFLSHILLIGPIIAVIGYNLKTKNLFNLNYIIFINDGCFNHFISYL